MIALPALISKPAKVSFTHAPGLHATSAQFSDFQEFHLTILPQAGEHLSSMLNRVQRFLAENEAVIVRQQVFGRAALESDAVRLMKLFFGTICWPLTWVDGNGGTDTEIAGMHFWAVHGTKVETVSFEGNVIGAGFEDGFARHLLLGKLAPADCFCSPAAQTRQVYDLLESTLMEAGMSLQNLVRTWLFLDAIGSWYGDLNKVRNLVYARQHLENLPASTGVGAANPLGSKLLAEAWALQALEENVIVQEIASPLQCGAPKYGSGFSRATEVSTPAWRRLTISGTASIAPDGSSVHDGDIDAQINLTMKVIESILKSRGLSFADTSRMTAYFKDMKDAPRFAQWLAANEIGSLPLIMTQADICRPELLFEVEMDTISTQRPSQKHLGQM